eukprot:361808-Chlamydomonas_euryale.AAC.5
MGVRMSAQLCMALRCMAWHRIFDARRMERLHSCTATGRFVQTCMHDIPPLECRAACCLHLIFPQVHARGSSPASPQMACMCKSTFWAPPLSWQWPSPSTPARARAARSAVCAALPI